MSYKASLIISVYDNIPFLRAVLDSLAYQTETNFEVIISEDAEHAELAQFVSSYPFRNDYQHLTQPDEGWRKEKALNNAIRAAKSDYLIFIDGDCVLHPRFIELCRHNTCHRGFPDTHYAGHDREFRKTLALH